MPAVNAPGRAEPSRCVARKTYLQPPKFHQSGVASKCTSTEPATGSHDFIPGKNLDASAALSAVFLMGSHILAWITCALTGIPCAFTLTDTSMLSAPRPSIAGAGQAFGWTSSASVAGRSAVEHAEQIVWLSPAIAMEMPRGINARRRCVIGKSVSSSLNTYLLLAPTQGYTLSQCAAASRRRPAQLRAYAKLLARSGLASAADGGDA